MEENRRTHEFLKYRFSEAEIVALSGAMAQKVTERQSTEDEKKAIMSDFKSQLDSIQADINAAAVKINNGYEMRQIECEEIPDYENKVWKYKRLDNGEIAKELPMSDNDMQVEANFSNEKNDGTVDEIPEDAEPLLEPKPTTIEDINGDDSPKKDEVEE